MKNFLSPVSPITCVGRLLLAFLAFCAFAPTGVLAQSASINLSAVTQTDYYSGSLKRKAEITYNALNVNCLGAYTITYNIQLLDISATCCTTYTSPIATATTLSTVTTNAAQTVDLDQLAATSGADVLRPGHKYQVTIGGSYACAGGGSTIIPTSGTATFDYYGFEIPEMQTYNSTGTLLTNANNACTPNLCSASRDPHCTIFDCFAANSLSFKGSNTPSVTGLKWRFSKDALAKDATNCCFYSNGTPTTYPSSGYGTPTSFGFNNTSGSSDIRLEYQYTTTISGTTYTRYFEGPYLRLTAIPFTFSASMSNATFCYQTSAANYVQVTPGVTAWPCSANVNMYDATKAFVKYRLLVGGVEIASSSGNGVQNIMLPAGLTPGTYNATVESLLSGNNDCTITKNISFTIQGAVPTLTCIPNVAATISTTYTGGYNFGSSTPPASLVANLLVNGSSVASQTISSPSSSGTVNLTTAIATSGIATVQLQLIAQGCTTLSPVCSTQVNSCGSTWPLTSYTIGTGTSQTVTTNVFVSQDIYVEGTLNLSGASLYFAPCTRLVVKKGGKLIVQNSVLQSCFDTWKGIEVWGDPTSSDRVYTNNIQGYLYMKDSRVYNADIGVISGARNSTGFDNSLGGGILDISKTDFDNNRVHIAAAEYPYPLVNSGVGFNVDNCNLKNVVDAFACEPFNSSNYVQNNPLVYLQNVYAYSIKNCTFDHTAAFILPFVNKTGIYAVNSSIATPPSGTWMSDIENNEFKVGLRNGATILEYQNNVQVLGNKNTNRNGITGSYCNNLNIDGNQFSNYLTSINQCILLQNCSNSVVNNNSATSTCDLGFTFNQCEDVVVSNNTLPSTYFTAIDILDCKRMNIKSNILTGFPSIPMNTPGINYYETASISSSDVNYIGSNRISSFETGMNFDGPASTLTAPMQFKLCQNVIYGNNTGIQGCGVVFQGNGTTEVPGDFFVDAFGNTNINANINWKNGLTYYSNGSTGTVPTNPPGVFYTAPCTNSYSVLSNFGSNPLGSACVVPRLSNPSNTQKDQQTVALFPNPGFGMFTVNSSDLINGVKIQNMLGQTVLSKQQNLRTTLLEVDASNLKSGFYIVVITKADGTSKSIRWTNLNR